MGTKDAVVAPPPTCLYAFKCAGASLLSSAPPPLQRAPGWLEQQPPSASRACMQSAEKFARTHEAHVVLTSHHKVLSMQTSHSALDPAAIQQAQTGPRAFSSPVNGTNRQATSAIQVQASHFDKEDDVAAICGSHRLPAGKRPAPLTLGALFVQPGLAKKPSMPGWPPPGFCCCLPPALLPAPGRAALAPPPRPPPPGALLGLLRLSRCSISRSLRMRRCSSTSTPASPAASASSLLLHPSAATEASRLVAAGAAGCTV